MRLDVHFDPPLQAGVLVRRYKRFLADIVGANGSELTAHCPNTGAMLGCSEPGSTVWYSTSDNPKRKYANTLEVVEVPDGRKQRVGVHPGRANALVAEALAAGRITPLAGYEFHHPEVPVPDEKGRFDFGLSSAPDKGRINCYVEVKSVTLCQGQGVGAFPDARSERALRHVQALARRADAGQRAVLFFCVQHTGVDRVRCADQIHPEYAEGVALAMAAGVEVLAYRCRVSSSELTIDTRLPFSVA